MQQVWQIATFDGAGPPDGGGDGQEPFPYKKRFEGPWMQQQLLLSISIGVISFVLFSLIRRRSPALFAPRTQLKGFAAHAKGIDDGVFSWIWPTLRTEEIKILHIVGLDAAILLSFFKMGFWTFAFLSIWTCGVLMPVNYYDHGTIDGVAPSEEPQDPKDPDGGKDIFSMLFQQLLPTGPSMPWTWRLPSTSLYHFTHLLSTYIFTALILRSLYKGFQKFVRSRQLYALDLLHSIPARTVEIRNLPDHLQAERDLAEYFEAMGFAVESTVVVREVRGLKDMLARRAKALYKLEATWCKWLGNPTTADYYDPDKVFELCQQRAASMADGGERMVLASHGGLVSVNAEADERTRLLGDSSDSSADPAAGIVAPKNRRRPTMRIQSWNPFSRRVDAITLLEARYRVLDATVQKMRSKGSPPSTTGFVTFIDAMSAQVVAQTVHYPIPAFCKTSLAPEPRDIIWSNVSIPTNERRLRQLFVTAFTIALFIFYIPPLAFLASLLLPSTIKKYLPTLYKLLEKNERLMAFASTNLPSVVLIAFNALLPLVLEWTAYLQGLKARSLVEFNVLKRYHLFLLISVIFIFLVTRTALGVLADLANNPMRIIDKLAQSLPQARHFSLSYVIFQSLAVIPLQLLQLPVTFFRMFFRLTARTPREYAELNAPPQLYAGSVYPAALIVYTLCIVYSVVSPLITVFGAIYFALAYLVYKYKVLYVFYRSYESRGQAWPLSSMRCLWALVLFQIFQLSLFSFRKQLLLSTLMLPLIIFTMWFGHFLSRSFDELSEHVSLSSIAEINKPSVPAGTDELAAAAVEGTSKQQSAASPIAASSSRVANTAATGDAEGMTSDKRRKIDAMEQRNPIVAMRTEALVDIDPSQTVLSRKRYSAKDDTLFVAQKDRHTDYREPPAGGYFYGTLNTGRRRYGHPALTGILPDIWPPVRVEDYDEKDDARHDLEDGAGSLTAEPASAGGVGGDSHTADGSENGSLIASGGGGGGGGRLRHLSRPKESVVVSLRRRKSSLQGGSMRSSPSSRFRQGLQGAEHVGSAEASSTDGAVGGSNLAFAPRRQLSSESGGGDDDGDDNCDVPGHQHEDSTRIWGTSAGASAPARQRLAATVEDDEAAAAESAVRRDGRRRIDSIVVIQQPGRASRANDEDGENDDDGDDDDDDEDDDDETDELQGVYIHRAARNTLPGSFPGFRH